MFVPYMTAHIGVWMVMGERLRLRSLILRQAKPTSVPWYKKYNWYSFALYRYKAGPHTMRYVSHWERGKMGKVSAAYRTAYSVSYPSKTPRESLVATLKCAHVQELYCPLSMAIFHVACAGQAGTFDPNWCRSCWFSQLKCSILSLPCMRRRQVYDAIWRVSATATIGRAP